jgi:hypothetical protein
MHQTTTNCPADQRKPLNGRPAFPGDRGPSSDDEGPAARECRDSGPANGQPLTLVELVEHEARGYRAWGTSEGDFLGRQLERLAQLVRFTGATTPEEFDERLEVLEADAREHRYQLGYGDGLEDGRQEFGRCWVE